MTEKKHQRYDMASPEWIKAYRDFLDRELVGEKFEGHNVVMSYEVTKNAPAHLLKDKKRLGWTITIADGKCEISDQPRDEADLMLVADYETERFILKLNNELHAHYQRNHRPDIISSGKFHVQGDPRKIPKVFETINVRDRFYVPYTA